MAASTTGAIGLLAATRGRLHPLFDRNAGFLAAALLQCLPVFVHVTSDALSESLYLLFVSTSLQCAVRAVRAPAAWGLCVDFMFSSDAISSACQLFLQALCDLLRDQILDLPPEGRELLHPA